MTELSKHLERITNLHVAVSDINGEIIFLRQLLTGGADKSYGVHVAKLAGLPPKIIGRAWEILAMLENNKSSIASTLNEGAGKPFQTQMFAHRNWLEEELSNTDIDAMTPLEALIKLQSLKDQTKNFN